jgi:hypothetical protein
MGDDDSQTYRPIRGGCQLQSESYSSASGTLGCLAETNRPGEPRKIVVLSVAHLLYAGMDVKAPAVITTPGERACQADACSKCSRCCSDDIGNALRGEFSLDVDAAIATLYVGTKYLREVEEIGPIRGTHEMTDPEAHDRANPFRVRKRGIRTRLTEGTVRLLDFVTDTKGLDDGFRRRAQGLVLIQPNTLFQGPVSAIQNNGVIRVDNAHFKALGVDKNKHVIEISGPTPNRGLYKINEVQSDTIIIPAHPLAPDFPAALTPQNQPALTPINDYLFDPLEGNGGLIFIRVREERFCDAADSGAVVVNDGGEVVGLLAGKVEDKNRPELGGYGFATPITLIKQRLGINILAAQLAGQEQIVADTEGEPDPDPAAIGRQAGGAAALPLHRHQLRTLRQAQQDLLETAGGKEYAALFRLHFEEVQTLINTNRRVAAVWQRNGGPLLAQVALNAVQNPDAPIPAEINGLPLELCLNKILDILDKYGSADLKSDIAQFGSSWTRFAGMSFNEVKHGLVSRPDNLRG